MTGPKALDPVELEIARNRLESIAEEVGIALIRTAYSPNIKDRRDCSAGVYRPDGELVAQAEHIPLHLGLMPIMIRNAIAEIGLDSLAEGDVVVTNNPYIGGSHLPDTCVITPVFHAGEPVAMIATMAHHVDVGGTTPGSMGTQSTEVFQEGLRLPTIKIITAAGVREDILSLLMMNVRTPDKLRGDLMAQVAANQLGVTRVQELATDWGADGFDRSCQELVAYAARRARAAIAELPDGEGRFTDVLEHDGNAPAEIAIVAAVRKNGEEIIIDLRECADQVEGAVNCSYAVADACAAYVVKVLADPSLPSNAGLMEPITVLTRPGSIVAATFPAPVAHGNTQTAQRIVDALLGAFEQFLPGLVPAASSGSMNIVTIGGVDPATTRYFSYIETNGGGQGAQRGHHGASAIHTHMTNTRNTPCEVIEREYPLRVERYAIARGTGGRGQWNGGDGLIRELSLTRGRASAVVATARVTQRPWGLDGAADATSAIVTYTDHEGSSVLEAMSRVDLVEGDRLTIQTAGGGGYGPETAAADRADDA